MPLGGIRIDENTLGFAKEADDFLTLGSAGCSSGDLSSFWRELSSNPERVQSFVVCLMVKLVALDSGQGTLLLSRNYCDICGLEVEIARLKEWMARERISSEEQKHLSLKLQHQILFTLFYLKQFYAHTPSSHLRNVHQRWSLARNCAKADLPKRCDDFEISVMKEYHRYGQEVPKIINPLEIHSQLLGEVVSGCCEQHRRGQCGYLPPRRGKLCNYRDIANSLSYYRLRTMVAGNPEQMNVVIKELVNMLSKRSSQTADFGEKEILLPILHLLLQFITECVDYNVASVYQVVQPFYLWPSPHSTVVKSLLDTIQTEDAIGGFNFREAVITEQQLDLPCQSAVKRQHHYMLIDATVSHTYSFQQAFKTQDTADPIALKKLLLRNLFFSVLPKVDLVKLDEHLEGMLENLDYYCQLALNYTVFIEEGTVEPSTTTENRMATVTRNLAQLYNQIMSQSPTSSPGSDQMPRPPSSSSSSSRQPKDFSLPKPYISTHLVTNPDNTIALQDKLKELIARSHRKSAGGSTRRHTVAIGKGSEDSGLDQDDDPYAQNTFFRPSSAPSNSMLRTSSGPRRNRSTSLIDPMLHSTSVPTSPTSNTASFSSTSLTASNCQDFSDGDSDSIKSSPSVSHSPTSSEGSTSLYSTSMLPRSTSYGQTNRLPDIGEGVSLVRLQKKGGMHTIRVRKKLRASKATTTTTKLLKIVLAGDDRLVNHVAYAYASLKKAEPSLFASLRIQFYYVPLSLSSTVDTFPTRRASTTNSEELLIHPLTDSVLPQDKIWLGCFVGNMDSWYERNVLLATQNLLRIIPLPKEGHDEMPTACSSPLPRDIANVAEHSPAQLLQMMVSRYCHEARSMIHFNIYSVELEIKHPKAPTTVKNSYYMLQRLDIQHLHKKGKAVKTFDAKFTMNEVTLDSSVLRQQSFAVKDTWSVSVSSVPRRYDLCVNNPEHDNVEVTITQASVEGRVSTSYKLSQEHSYHARNFEMLVPKERVSVMIDGDSSVIENVTKITVQPAMESSVTGNGFTTGQQSKQVFLPLMTFWPVDL